MGTQNNLLNSLYTYLRNGAKYDHLKAKLNQIEQRIEKYDETIEQFEKLGNNPFVEFAIETRNTLNLKRIQVNLKLVAIEKEMLEFELMVATRN